MAGDKKMKMKRIAEQVAKGSSLAKAIRNNGYSPKTARAPGKITKQKEYKEAVEDVVAKMKQERDRALNLMKKKIGKAKYRDLIDGADKMTKNVQLLEGKPTEINKLTSEDVEERIKQLRAIGGRPKSAGNK